MNAILYRYHVNDATWFYLSLLLIVAVYFRFNRLWSLRNLDLALLLSITPGLLFLDVQPALGNVWLFVVSGLLLLRLFCDGLLERRPRLEQNLNRPGLAFLGIAAFAFLMTSVIAKPVPESAADTVRRGSQMRKGTPAHAAPAERTPAAAGPASSILTAPVDGLVEAVATGNGTYNHIPGGIETVTARVMAILAQLAVVVGLFALGWRHFGDAGLGIGMAALYLLLPCTAYKAGELNHVLPSALIVWALVAYQRPVVAGILLGLACGTLVFPVFLLPLWAVFYGRRAALRFGAALAAVGTVLLVGMVVISGDPNSFVRQTLGWINWQALEFHAGSGAGFWSTHNTAYRIPVFVGFAIMLVVLTVWPRQKNLEHLIASSTAIVVGTQFWYPQAGGVYLLWYLPLLLLVVFRPRLAVPAPRVAAPERVETPATPRPLRRELVGSGAGGSPFLR
jgi:hypothetical protein